jgi:chromosomal replication initiator protein
MSPKTLWSGIIKSVIEKKEFQETSIENWLKPLSPTIYADGILYLETTNNFAPQVLNARYKPKLCEIAKKIDENFKSMNFTVAGEIKNDDEPKEKTSQTLQSPINLSSQRNTKASFTHPINKKYTFDNFVNTYENQLAVGSARGIANSPGKMREYNPFYIYGKAGVGKTHILHAIANEIIKNDPDKRIILISGEGFYRNYSAHLSKQLYNDFEKAFEQANAVLFDNIHELSGKREAQLELYKVFNKFHRQNKQIVFAANCSPSELSGMTERLISRFQWGLAVKLDVANIETRTAILENMTRKENIKISDEEIAYIVENCSENIHELQGIVANIAVSISLNKTASASDAVQKAMKNKRLEPIKGYYSAKTILEVVGSFYKIDLEDLKGKSRVAQIVWARHIAIYFLKKYTPLSLSAIGNEVGGKNHATVLHSIKEVESKASNEDVLKEIKEINTLLARN